MMICWTSGDADAPTGGAWMETAMPTRRKAKQKRKPRIEFESYLCRIRDWEPSYSFSLGPPAFGDGAYSEHAQLRVEAELIYPARLRGRIVNVVLLGSRREARQLQEPGASEQTPLCVGELTVRGDRSEYLGGLPFDALWGVAAALSSGAVRYLDLHGRTLFRGVAQIRRIAFRRDFEPEDFPGVAADG